MGKYASTRAFQRDRKKTKDSSSNTLKGAVDYVLEKPKDETQYHVQAFLYGADPTGLYSGWISSRDSTQYMRDYLKNTGLTWTDILYPSRTIGYGAFGSYIRNSFNYVSKNIARLYR